MTDEKCGKDPEGIYSLTIGRINEKHVEVELHNRWRFVFENREYCVRRLMMDKRDIHRLCELNGSDELTEKQVLEYKLGMAGKYLQKRLSEKQERRERRYADGLSIEDESVNENSGGKADILDGEDLFEDSAN